MRRRNLNRRVTLQRSKSVTHTRVKQAILRTLARCQWMKLVNICTRTVKCAARPGVVDARRLMLRSIDHDVADTAIARGVHGDTSRIKRSRGFALLPKHKHVRNFAGVQTGAKILCFKKKKNVTVCLLCFCLPLPPCGTAPHPIREMRRTPTPQNLNAALAHYKNRL